MRYRSPLVITIENGENGSLRFRPRTASSMVPLDWWLLMRKLGVR